jgi:hypothetical protein
MPMVNASQGALAAMEEQAADALVAKVPIIGALRRGACAKLRILRADAFAPAALAPQWRCACGRPARRASRTWRRRC